VAVLFYIGKYHGWSVPVYAGMATALIVILIGFARLYLRSDLWRLGHAESEKLDEREIQLTLTSMKYAYGIFAIVSLLVVLVLALMAKSHDSMLIVIFAGLLYLAHTLPSAVIAWTQKRI
jgi:ABC-type Fe3+ transport system permease subunit